jgi:hypothetical protein
MLFEIAGFLLGMVAVGSAMLMLYRRQTNRVLDAIHATAGARQRI